MGFDVTI